MVSNKECRKIWMTQNVQKRTDKAVERLKKTRIENHVYDIHTLQNQRKFENQSKIRNIRINRNVYEGTIDVVKAIEGEMEEEVNGFRTNIDDVSRSEEEFLNTIQKN